MNVSHKQYAIGVFDSGLGGLTVVKALKKQLPFEHIVYFGDTARVPYGTKSKDSIVRFSHENVKVLLKHKVKLIVVACNSSSSFAIPSLKSTYRLPIMGVIQPGAKKAVETTQNRRVGIIATAATVASGRYSSAIKEINSQIKVYAEACPLFVPLVEEGWTQKKITLDIANVYLSSLKKARIDTLILGCTHYPLLKNLIKKSMGSKVTLVDSAKEVATQVKEFLAQQQMVKTSKTHGRLKCIVSDKPQQFKGLAKKFLGFDIQVTKEQLHV